MELLERLYRGKIGYFGEIRIENADYAAAGKRMIEAEKQLIEKHPEIEALFEEYQAIHSEVINKSEYEKFALEFRIGAQLMLEMLKPIE